MDQSTVTYFTYISDTWFCFSFIYKKKTKNKIKNRMKKNSIYSASVLNFV